MSSGRLGRRFGVATAIAVMACSCMPAMQGGSVFGAEPEPAYLGGFGPDGTEASEFDRVGSVAVNQENGSVYVSDPEQQVLYKFDEDGQPVDFGGSAAYLEENRITGLAINEGFLRSQVAVNSEAGVIYLTSGNAVRAFAEDGEPHEFPALGSSEIPGATELVGVAVDADGNIYASDFAEAIRIYSPSGSLLNEIALPSGINPGQIAVTPKGDVLMVEDNVTYRLVPSATPVTGSTTYTLETEALDPKLTFSVGVDPGTGFIYLGQRLPGESGRVLVLEENGEPVGTLGAAGQDGEFGPDRVVGSAIRAGNRAYFAAHKEVGLETSGMVQMFEPFNLFVGPPSVTATAVTDLASTSATLRARINPNTLPTTYRFEYGPEDCEASPGACTSVPADPEGIGSGHELVPVSQPLSGLSPDTTYFYRVVAENVGEKGGLEEGPLRTFTTQSSSFGFELGDGRVWEQVSPSQKFGGGITNGTLVQASADGDAIGFPTRGSIVVDPDGNRALEVSAVVARRTGGGTWQVEDLVPPYTKATGAGLGPEYKVFSPDLERSVLEPREESPLSVEASERTPYLREDGTPPSFRPIVTGKEGFANVEPPDTEFGGEINGAKNPIALEGADAELTDVVVSSKAPLLAGAPPLVPDSNTTRALYRWKDGALSPVSVLPDDEGGGFVYGQVGSGLSSVRHAVSSDGSRVFWNPAIPIGPTLDLDALYLRETVAEETVRIDVPEDDATGEGAEEPFFMGASADGAVVYFTDSQQLTGDANPAGRDLYRCEVGSEGEGCSDLEDLTGSGSVVGGERADAEEIAAGISEDGATVYFVARGILDAQPNEAGESAQPESPNLYQWREGAGLSFIATLSENDGPDWGQAGDSSAGRTAKSSAFTSPGGRYLTFMSERNLAGDESDDPETGEPTEQVFLYDSEAESLSCVSCNPNGGTDAARQIKKGTSEGGLLFPDLQQLWAGRFVGATLPESTESEPTIGYSFYQPRAVLDNGRVFYNSVAPLVSADSNGTWDVYQYEPLGVGTCGPLSGSSTVARSGEGCIALISSGTDSNASVFLDASESGDDLFFMTFARLSALDTDEIVDVYDARVGGVEAVLEPSPEPCAGEACQSRPPAPSEGPPGSATFNGAGNVKPKPPKHCRKGQRKVKRNGKVRCVKKKKSKKADASSGAGR